MLQKLLPVPVARIFQSFNGSSEKITKYLDWISEPFEGRYRSLSYDLSGSIKQKMYSPHFKSVLTNDFNDYYSALHQKSLGKTLLQRMSYIDMKSWLAEDILLKADRMTMSASVEMRAPFLDQELVEFAVSLPDKYKLKNSEGKEILKHIMEPLLPVEITYRKKKGFPVPLTSWFRGKLNKRAKSLLLDRRTLERNYFNKDYVEGLFDKIAAGQDMGRRIFSLVVLETWHRKYID